MSTAAIGISVSVCIPTCNRPSLLRQTVASILSQDVRPLEILVSDDSPATAPTPDLGDEVSYRRNDPPLGQAGNVNALFARAAGSHVLLVHDDDLLLPGCVRRLVEALGQNPAAVAAYGRQRLIDDDGNDLGQAAADSLNRNFRRTPGDSGLQSDSLSMALLRQFPNDGFLLRSDVARAVGYRGVAEVGHACDADFAVRVGLARPREAFVLVDAETCAYRISRASIARDGSAAAASFYGVLRKTKVPPHAEAARQTALRDLAPAACGDFLRLGRRRDALGVWLGRPYGSRRFGPRGLASAASAVVPFVYPLLRALRPRGHANAH